MNFLTMSKRNLWKDGKIEQFKQKGEKMSKKDVQKTINKYQSKFDRLMKSIEKDKMLKKMKGNATAGIAVQMIKDLKNYLKVNKV